MNWRPVSKHLLKLAGGLVATLVLYAALRDSSIYEFTSRETEGFNTLVLLLGSIYAVMFAFVIFVIWGQFTEVERLAARECGSLNELLRLSRYANPDKQRPIRRAIAEYCRLVLTAEWDALGDRRKDAETEKAFTQLLQAVVQAVPATPPEEVIHERLIDSARNVGECRDERIGKSLTRIPPTLMLLVRSMASALVLLMFVYPFHHSAVGACCFVLVASILFFADVVMTDMDNPFSGLCNVSPRVFADLTG